MQSVRVRDIDRGWGKFIRSLKGPTGVRVGLLGKAEEAHENAEGKTVAEIGAIHEYGLGPPERSFLRAWFDANEDRINREIDAVLQRVADQKITLDQAWELLGQRYVGEIQTRISQGIPPPLAESTVQRKRSAIPLIDTGQLRSAITYEIIKRAAR